MNTHNTNSLIKKTGLALVPTALLLNTLLTPSVHAAFGSQQPIMDIGKNNLDTTVQNIVNNILVFLTILAVLYGVYGGFLIVTAGGDEGGVKKGRTIIMQVAIGIIVIWLAGSIIKFVMGLIAGT